EQVESARITSIARLYDGMRPEQVGKLFENLDDKAVMAILPRMKSANAAKIMAIMPPKRAARISTKMITVMEK
ncbi:MAG: magnesium transporter MgtE, partial [Candidatus Zixiibacteriota bacterium]